jgi:hypothetical protein
MDSRGFAKLSTVITVTLAIGFVASAFLNISQHQRAQQDHKMMQGEITDLRYQVNQDRLALGEASPSPSPKASPSSSPAAAPTASASPSPTPAAVLDANTQTKTVKQTGSASTQPNLRRQPNSSLTPLISHVPAGTPVTLVDDSLQNGYRHVTISGQTGYILASYLE